MNGLLTISWSRLNRKDSTKIGFKTKYYISSRLIKTPSSKSKVKFEAEKNPLRNYSDQNNNAFECKLVSEYNFNNNKINTFNSISSKNDYYYSFSNSSCPYCYKFRKISENEYSKNFHSLVEFKESDYTCSISCPLQKFNSIRRNDLKNKESNKNDEQSSKKLINSSLRKKRKSPKSSQVSSLKTSF